MNGRAMISALLLVLTGICAATDLRDGRIYNVVLIPAAVLGMVLQGVPACGGSLPAAGAAMLRMGMMLLLLLPFWALIPNGIGGGDIKLYAVVGILVRGEALFVLVLLSLLIAAGYGLFLRIAGRGDGQTRIGPAVLCAASLYVGGIYG